MNLVLTTIVVIKNAIMNPVTTVSALRERKKRNLTGRRTRQVVENTKRGEFAEDISTAIMSNQFEKHVEN